MALFPNVGFSQVTPISHSPDYVSESHSLKTITSSTGAQRFEFEVTTSVLDEADFMKAWAFLNSRAASRKAFDIEFPLLSFTRGAVSGQVRAQSALAKGDDTATLTNFIGNIGDFISFAGHTKAYQLTSVAGNDVEFYPPLLKAVATNEVVDVNNVYFNVRLSGKLSKLPIDKTKTARLKFKCYEAIS